MDPWNDKTVFEILQFIGVVIVFLAEKLRRKGKGVFHRVFDSRTVTCKIDELQSVIVIFGTHE